MASELLSERQGAVLLLTISDPSTRNALSHPVIAAGIEALRVTEADDGVRCIVLRGDAGHFCAGGNLNGLMQRRREGPAAQAEMLDHLHQWIVAIRAHPKPVIAAVEGAAAGAGFALALACDLLVAAEDARFVLSHAQLGLSPDGGATWSLAHALPRALVQQLVWLAEPVSARQLQSWGLAGWVADRGQALGQALRVATQLCAMAPNALASGKKLVQGATSATLTEQLAAEHEHFICNLFHANGGEGLRAFFDKRPPQFQ